MLNYEVVKSWRFDDVVHAYTQRDTMLYALGIGMGHDPLDAGQLRYVYEKDLQAVPTMAAVLGMVAGWMREPSTGIDYTRIVHGEQDLRIHKPLPVAASLLAKNRVSRICDKGEGKGAVIEMMRDIFSEDGSELLASVRQVTFARAEGGFSVESGVSDPAPEALRAVPERAPDIEVDLPSLAQSALLYRLSGDYNPLHADPEVAGKAGFPRPILHGLCTYGMAAHAVLRACCDYDATRFKRVAVRMTSPVYPGETVRFQLWREGPTLVRLRAHIEARDVVVLNNGIVELG